MILTALTLLNSIAPSSALSQVLTVSSMSMLNRPDSHTESPDTSEWVVCGLPISTFCRQLDTQHPLAKSLLLSSPPRDSVFITNIPPNSRGLVSISIMPPSVDIIGIAFHYNTHTELYIFNNGRLEEHLRKNISRKLALKCLSHSIQKAINDGKLTADTILDNPLTR